MHFLGKQIWTLWGKNLLLWEQILSFTSSPLLKGSILQESKQEVRELFPFEKMWGKKGRNPYTLTLLHSERPKLLEFWPFSVQ